MNRNAAGFSLVGGVVMVRNLQQEGLPHQLFYHQQQSSIYLVYKEYKRLPNTQKKIEEKPHMVNVNVNLEVVLC